MDKVTRMVKDDLTPLPYLSELEKIIQMNSKNALRVMKFDIEIAKTTPTSFGPSMNPVP